MADSVLRQRDKRNHTFYGKGNMRTKIATCSLVALLGIQSVFGKENHPQDYKHDFTLGLESFHYKYEESTPEHKNLMHLKNMKYGVNGSYQFTWQDKLFVRPEFRWAYGHEDYQNFRGKKSEMKHIPSMIVEPRLLIGSPLNIISNLTLSPYTGVGYRYKWDDESDIKGKDNIAGYKRINKLWYVPLGMIFKYDLTDQWHVQGMAEYDFMIEGKQYTYIKNRAPSPIMNKQTKGFGLRAELLVGRQFEKVSLSVGPYINYWKIEKSKKTFSIIEYEPNKFANDPTMYEPKNSTTELGLKFNVQF
jgi:hypothetical protein